MPTAYGSQAYVGNQPTVDAQVVQTLKAAGAILMGKTVTTEFAHVHAGPTVNPHNVLHTPGGSSSGSAAAVADGMVTMALGTQTGGSTIRPAAYCGIVGFKPTYGRIDLGGVMPLAAAMDTMGLMARSVDDIILLSSVLLGPAVFGSSVRGPTSQAVSNAETQHPTFAWFVGPDAAEADPDAIARLSRAREVLIEQGATCVELDLRDEAFVGVSRANRQIMAYQAGHHHVALYRTQPEKLGATTRQLIESGLLMDAAQFEQEIAIAEEARTRFLLAMQGIDALLTLSAPGPAPRVVQGTGASTFNRIWTTIGAPCVTLPAGKNHSGLPLGVQFVASHGQDDALLKLAKRFESIFKA